MPRSKGSQIAGDANGSPASAKPRRKTGNSAGHDCTICRKSNMTLSGLKIHLLTHSGEKPFACTVCDKRFTCSSNLKKHQRIHTRDYIYECPVCGKTCSDPSNMKKHMTVHSDEKAYTCPSCGKSYSYAQSLRQHMDDVHVASGERRRKSKKKGHFPCPECGKVFGYYWRCSLHQARIHAVEKPYKCPECGKAFARETILNKHIQTHEKPFPCTVCERRFSFRDQLRKHMRTHTGEKPYTCEQCLRSFTQRGSLTEHMRIHTGEKPFACSNCGQRFSSSSSLKRHERRVNACLTQRPAEEIPLADSLNRRVIYIGTPVSLGLASSTISQPLMMEHSIVSPYSTMQDYGNDTIAFHPSTLTDSGRITMVPANFSPSMPMENASCFAIPSEDVKPTLTHDGRIVVATPDFQPNYNMNSIEHSVLTSLHQSIAMDLRDVMYRNNTILASEDVKPFQNEPSVTLTTDGLKPLASIEAASNPVNYQTRSPSIPHLDMNGRYCYTQQLSPVGLPVGINSISTKDVVPLIQAHTIASTNAQPSEYPRAAVIVQDVKPLSVMNGINSIAPAHLLPSNGTITSTLVTA